MRRLLAITVLALALSSCGKGTGLPAEVGGGGSGLPPGELPTGDLDTGDVNGFVLAPDPNPPPPGFGPRDIVTPMTLTPGG